MQKYAQSWLVFDLTQVELLPRARRLPEPAADPAVHADRRRHRRSARSAAAAHRIAIRAGVLGVRAGGARLDRSDHHSRCIFALSFISGCGQAFGGPAYQSLIPSLVPRRDLPNAIALNSTQFNLSRVLGPVAGGAGPARHRRRLVLRAQRPLVLPRRVRARRRCTCRRTCRSTQPRAIGEELQRRPALRARQPLLMIAHDPRLRDHVPGDADLDDAAGVCHDARGGRRHAAIAAVDADGLSGTRRDPRRAHRRQPRPVQAHGPRAARRADPARTAASPASPRRRSLPSQPGAALHRRASSPWRSFSISFSLLQLTVPDELRGRVVSIYMVALRGGWPIGGLVAGALADVFSAPTRDDRQRPRARAARRDDAAPPARDTQSGVDSQELRFGVSARRSGLRNGSSEVTRG